MAGCDGKTKADADTGTVEELQAAFEAAVDEATNILDAAVAQGRELTAGEKKSHEDALLRAEGLGSRLRRARRKADREAGAAEARSGAFSTSMGDVARLFTEGATYTPEGGKAATAATGKRWMQAILRANPDGVRGGAKALTPSGTVVVGIEPPRPVEMGRPVAMLRSLIPAQPSNGIFAYLQQTLRQSNAAMVAPGTLKPTSRFGLQRVQDHCRTVAHLSEGIPRQDIEDSELLGSFLSEELAWGLEAEIEDQLLNGDGIGENFTGLANTAGVQTVAPVDPGTGDYFMIRTLRRAITRLESIGLVASGICLSPADYEAIESAATDVGSLVLNGAGETVPIDRAARRLWGVPVVSTPACVPGTAYVADFATSTRCFVRSEAVLSWSENLYDKDALGPGIGASHFALNLVAFRCEARIGFAVTRPAGVVKVAFV